MLRSSRGDSRPSNATELSKFREEKHGVFRSGMELSIAPICCLLLNLLAGKFHGTKQLNYFNFFVLRRRRWSAAFPKNGSDGHWLQQANS